MKFLTIIASVSLLIISFSSLAEGAVNVSPRPVTSSPQSTSTGMATISASIVSAASFGKTENAERTTTSNSSTQNVHGSIMNIKEESFPLIVLNCE